MINFYLLPFFHD